MTNYKNSVGTESGNSEESSEGELFERMNRMNIGQRKLLKDMNKIKHYTLMNQSYMTRTISGKSNMEP